MSRRSNHERSSRSGFTLVELLIAAGIFGVILLALTGLFVNSTRAYRVNETISERQQDTQAAIALFQQELSLAGYRGVCSNASSNTFAQPTFAVVRGSADADAPGDDTISIRYFDDRYSGNACGLLRTVTFTAGTDEQGRPALLMQTEGITTPTPVVAGVTGLRLFGYVDNNGGLATDTMPSTGFMAVSIELDFADGRFVRFVVGLRNPQSGAVQS